MLELALDNAATAMRTGDTPPDDTDLGALDLCLRLVYVRQTLQSKYEHQPPHTNDNTHLAEVELGIRLVANALNLHKRRVWARVALSPLVTKDAAFCVESARATPVRISSYAITPRAEVRACGESSKAHRVDGMKGTEGEDGEPLLRGGGESESRMPWDGSKVAPVSQPADGENLRPTLVARCFKMLKNSGLAPKVESGTSLATLYCSERIFSFNVKHDLAPILLLAMNVSNNTVGATIELGLLEVLYLFVCSMSSHVCRATKPNRSAASLLRRSARFRLSSGLCTPQCRRY